MVLLQSFEYFMALVQARNLMLKSLGDSRGKRGINSAYSSRVFEPVPSLTMALSFIVKRRITLIPSVVRCIKEESRGTEFLNRF